MSLAQTITLYPSHCAEPAPLRRIRRLALPFEIGFAGLAVVAGAFALLIVIAAYLPGDYVRFNAEGGWISGNPAEFPVDAVGVTSLPLMTQLIGGAVFIVINVALVTALWSLHQLFAAYRRGQVFAAAPIALMRRAGLALVLFAMAPGLAQPLMRALGSPDRNWFHGETIPVLIVGAVLFLFAHIIALGVELERENKGFV